MEIIDNVSSLIGDDLEKTIGRGDRVRCVAPAFSIYAYEALRHSLEELAQFELVFPGPSFIADGSGHAPPHRQFVIPPTMSPRDLTGTPFELRLRNRMTARGTAQDCARWIRKVGRFKANVSGGNMPTFLSVEGSEASTIYMNLPGFTASDLGYEPDGNLNMISRTTDHAAGAKYREVFDQLWSDQSRLEDVTEALCRQIEATYAENAPSRIYHLILASIFRTFLEEVSDDTLPNDRTGYRDTKVWNTLYRFQQDAVVGLIEVVREI